MFVFLTILILLAAVLLILVVVIQNSKGGGLASGFSSSNQIMGVRKTTDFLEKATWVLAGAIVLLSIVSAGFLKSEVKSESSQVIEKLEQSAPVKEQPEMPTLPAPEQPEKTIPNN